MLCRAAGVWSAELIYAIGAVPRESARGRLLPCEAAIRLCCCLLCDAASVVYLLRPAGWQQTCRVFWPLVSLSLDVWLPCRLRQHARQ